jgi:hypothetical protein
MIIEVAYLARGLRTVKSILAMAALILLSSCGTSTTGTSITDAGSYFMPQVTETVVPCPIPLDEYQQTARQKFDEQVTTVAGWCEEGSQGACKRYEHMLDNRTRLVSEEEHRVEKDAPPQVCHEFSDSTKSYARWRSGSQLCEQFDGGTPHCWKEKD